MPEEQDIYRERWVEQPETNGLAIAGFVCSLLGLLTFGLLSPVGLVLSLGAMFRPPRGLAVAGLVLGLIGSLGFLLIILIVILAIVVAGAAVTAAVFGGQVGLGGIVETWLDGSKVRDAIVKFHDETGDWPSTVESLEGLEPGTLLDYWGNPYEFTIKIDREELLIHTFGMDGVEDTDDDFHHEFDLDRD